MFGRLKKRQYLVVYLVKNPIQVAYGNIHAVISGKLTWSQVEKIRSLIAEECLTAEKHICILSIIELEK